MTSSGQRSAHAEASPFQIMGGSGSKRSNSRPKYAITSSRLRKPHATRVKRPSRAAPLAYSSAFVFSAQGGHTADLAAGNGRQNRPQTCSDDVACQIVYGFAGRGKYFHEQGISARLAELRQQVHCEDVEHPVLTREWQGIPGHVLQDSEQRRGHLVAPGDGLPARGSGHAPEGAAELRQAVI